MGESKQTAHSVVESWLTVPSFRRLDRSTLVHHPMRATTTFLCVSCKMTQRSAYAVPPCKNSVLAGRAKASYRHARRSPSPPVHNDSPRPPHTESFPILHIFSFPTPRPRPIEHLSMHVCMLYSCFLPALTAFLCYDLVTTLTIFFTPAFLVNGFIFNVP